MTIGLFGGTFDPVHYGHLRLALEALETLKLSRVVFIPVGVPYQKRVLPRADGNARVHMLRLATRDEPRFAVDDREVLRGGATYTYDTLIELRKELGPAVPLVWLIGMDAFLHINTWHRWKELFTLAHFAVFPRADGSEPTPAEQQLAVSAVAASVPAAMTADMRTLLKQPAGLVCRVDIASRRVSSTEIRDQLASQHSPRYLLPDAVLSYVREHRLYTSMKGEHAQET